MTRILFGLTLLLALSACSDDPPKKPGEWERFTLANGAVSFAMPHAPDRRTAENGEGGERITEEIAACEYYAEGLGVCQLHISVMSGPSLPGEMGATAAERRKFSKFLLVGMISQEDEKRKIEEEGPWSFGDESGYFLRVALPKAPPKRTVPVMNWTRVSPLGDRVLIVQFIGTQAGFENSLLKPKMDKVREKFFGSVAAE